MVTVSRTATLLAWALWANAAAVATLSNFINMLPLTAKVMPAKREVRFEVLPPTEN
jgi:hypothetical protein